MRMRMKKLLSILLVTAMLASMAVTAFADTNVTASNGDIMVAEWQDSDVIDVAINSNGATAEIENNVEAPKVENVVLTVPTTAGTDYTLEVAVAKGETPVTEGVTFTADSALTAVTENSSYTFAGAADAAETSLTFTEVSFPKNTDTEDAVYTITFTAAEKAGGSTRALTQVVGTATVTVKGTGSKNEATLTITAADTAFQKDAEGKYKGTAAVNNSDQEAAEFAITGTVGDGSVGSVEVAVKSAAPSRASVNVPAGGQTLDVTVTMNKDAAAGTYDVKLQVGDEAAVKVGTVTVEAANPEDKEVTATLTVDAEATDNVASGKITFTNPTGKAATAKVTVTVDGAEVTPSGEQTIEIKDTDATKDFTFTVTCPENETAEAKDYTVTAAITVDGEAVTVTPATVTIPGKVVDPPVGDKKVTATISAFDEKTYEGTVTVENKTAEKVEGVTVEGTVTGPDGKEVANALAITGSPVAVEAGQTGNVTFKVTLPEKAAEGQYTVTLNVKGTTDATTLTQKITVEPAEVPETGAIAVSMTKPEKQEETNTYTSTITLTGTGEAAVTAVAVPTAGGANVNGTITGEGFAEGKITVTNEATLKLEVALPDQYEYTITVTATDKDGNIKTAKAVVGEKKDEGGNENPGGDNNGSSNSGSSSSGSSSSTPANAPSANVGAGGAVSAAKISGDAKKAVSNAKNGKANVNVTNAKTVGTAALNNMAKAAAKEDVALTMTAKTTDKNGVVVASLKFDATKAAEAVAKAGTKEVKLGVELNTKNTKNVTSLFKKWFKNKNMTAVKMAQKGEFGFTVEAAVKVDLKNFNKNNLKFYSYNAATNTYKEIETKYTIDAKGLVHFNTTVGNYIIITDAPIASK